MNAKLSSLCVPLACYGVCIHVCSQMVALALLLACKDGGQGLFFETAANLGPLLLVVAAWLTVHSLAIYIGGLWRFLAH